MAGSRNGWDVVRCITHLKGKKPCRETPETQAREMAAVTSVTSRGYRGEREAVRDARAGAGEGDPEEGTTGEGGPSGQRARRRAATCDGPRADPGWNRAGEIPGDVEPLPGRAPAPSLMGFNSILEMTHY